MLALTPTPPYYAVIFSSLKNSADEGYAEMAEKMEKLAERQAGYLGIESARSGLGITVSYWKDLPSIQRWRENTEHVLAQQMGITKFYEQYVVRVCLVEREYRFNRSSAYDK